MEETVLLAPNEVIPFTDLRIRYPIFMSRKMDGHRNLLRVGKFLSRTLKEQPNKNLPFHLKEIQKLSIDRKLVFDGEIYNHNAAFNKLSGSLRGFDGDLTGFKYYLFDMLSGYEWENGSNGYTVRLSSLDLIKELKLPNVEIVEQVLVKNPDEAEELYRKFLEEGYEGAIGRNPNSLYKHNRGTLREGIIFKFKESKDEDGQIIEVVQGLKMKDGLTRVRDVRGYLERSHKQEDYIPDDCVGALKVRMKDGTIVGCGFARGWDEEKKRREIWIPRDKIIGKWIQFKYIPHGTINKPRSGRMERFRPDLDHDNGTTL
jgi:ATP-dependent DNA ligase